jgi:uncharacterized membrane protein
MRALYISFPLMAWLFGHWSFLVCVVLLVGLLRVVDVHFADGWNLDASWKKS